MQIERIDHSSLPEAVFSRKPQAQEPIEEPLAEEPTEGPISETEDTEGQPGVLRLLQEGHFKGVADVRLRINFFEELQAMESQGRTEAAASGFAEFDQSLEGDLRALQDSGELTEEQTAALDGFLQQMQALQDGFNGTTPFAEVLTQMQAQFDGLLASLNPPASEETQETEPPQEPVEEEQIAAAELPLEETVEETPPQETQEIIVPELASEEPSVFEQLVANLRNSFQQALERLASSLDTPGTLPPPSEPSGNGKAYAKFLAIYESMQSGDALPPAEAVDTQASDPGIEA